jgi:hypothetical protein
MGENVIDGSYTRYRMPTEEGLAKDLANGTIKKEVSTTNNTTNTKNTFSESYVLGHNSVE